MENFDIETCEDGYIIDFGMGADRGELVQAECE